MVNNKQLFRVSLGCQSELAGAIEAIKSGLIWLRFIGRRTAFVYERFRS